jgi:cytochrome c5
MSALRAMLVLAVAALTLSAGAVAAFAQSAGGSFAPREEQPEQFPAGAGRDETFYACTACHNFKLVAAQGMNRRQWEDSLAWMTQRHGMPPLEAKERETVLNYLEQTFPPRAPAAGGGWQNPFMKR